MPFVVSRVVYAVKSYGTRVNRLIYHILFIADDCKARAEHWYDYKVDLFFYIVDLFCISEILDLIHNGLKPKRKLTAEELEIALSIFGNDINYEAVYLTEKTIPYRPNLFHAYVSFNTINSVEALSTDILIHELVHIWQYQKYGSVYIYRALKAQNSKAGYDYGGLNGLLDHLKYDSGLLHFNFEQQACIVEDYFKLVADNIADISILKIYEHFVSHLAYKKPRFVA